MDEYMLEDELCAYLKISKDQLKRIRQRREIAWYKFGGKPHFKREDADDYAARQKVCALVDRPHLEIAAERCGPGRPKKIDPSVQFWKPGMKVV